MKQIKNVSKGPRGLVKCLNSIIDALNNLEIIHGAGGNYATVTSNGWILTAQPTVAKPSETEAGSTPAAGSGEGGGGLTQLQIDTLAALVAPPSSPASGTFYPFTSGGVAQNEGWLGISTVNPSTCVQTIISVWAANPAGVGGGGL
jgi:hypothetical protein